MRTGLAAQQDFDALSFIGMPPGTRVARSTDRDALYEMLMHLYIDNPDPAAVAISHEKLWKHIDAGTTGNGIIGVIDGAASPAGSIAIFPVQPWYSDEWVLSVHWLYVEPGARAAGGLHKSLFRFAQWHRADMERRVGKKLLCDCSFVSRSRIPARERLWSRYADKSGALFLLKRDDR